MDASQLVAQADLLRAQKHALDQQQAELQAMQAQVIQQAASASSGLPAALADAIGLGDDNATQLAGPPGKRHCPEDVELPDADDMCDVFTAHVSDKLPPPVLAKLKNLHKELSTNIERMLKLREAVSGIQADIDKLSKGEIPKGCKPYVAKGHTATMETVKLEEESFQLNIPTGTSLADAKRAIYIWSLRCNKVIDLRARAHQLDEVEDATDFYKFTTTASQAGSAHAGYVSMI